MGLADSLPGGHAVLHCLWCEGLAARGPALGLGVTQTMAALVGGQPCLIVTFVCHSVGTVLRNPAQVLTSQLGPCFGNVVCSGPLPIFIWVACFLVEFQELFVYFGYQSLVRCVFANTFSPSEACLLLSTLSSGQQRFRLVEVQLVRPVPHE